MKGVHEHFKGRKYQVIGTARHSEMQEELVIYHVLGEEQLWARPKSMFLEEVEKDGKKVPRFRLLEKHNP